MCFWGASKAKSEKICGCHYYGWDSEVCSSSTSHGGCSPCPKRKNDGAKERALWLRVLWNPNSVPSTYIRTRVQLPIIPTPGDLTRSSTNQGTLIHVAYTHMDTQIKGNLFKMWWYCHCDAFRCEVGTVVVHFHPVGGRNAPALPHALVRKVWKQLRMFRPAECLSCKHDSMSSEMQHHKNSWVWPSRPAIPAPGDRGIPGTDWLIGLFNQWAPGPMRDYILENKEGSS